MKQVFDDNIQDTSVLYMHETRVRSQIIYSITLLAIILSVLALPFIHTTISVKGLGLVQSNIEKTEILAPVSGKIVAINLKDNQKVHKGDLLIRIDAAIPKQQSDILSNKNNQLQNLLNDAEMLIKALDFGKETVSLQTGLYNSSWQQYLEQQQNALNAKEQSFKIYKRYETLHTKRVVTQAEYEQYKYNYEQALSDLKMVAKRYRTQWQTEANQYRNELKEIQNQKIQLNEQEKLYTVNSQLSGSVQNLTGLQIGAYVYANQKIADISPDTALLAFCFIKPSDIGLIKKGQHVRFQIDAFNYNQWGMLTGKVVDISDDIFVQDKTTYFKVKCKFDKNYLQLKNGYKGHIKKGMSFNANFTVTQRSLFQLLYDKVDDWINPETARKS
jgi:membrane fusion protein, peptide pheromone/bacteriocin exporter